MPESEAPHIKGARQRVRGQKAKSGCRTCKVRKVKCDEGKPACQRCIRFGADCEGYPPLFRTDDFAGSSRTASTILPKPAFDHNLPPPFPTSPHAILATPTPSSMTTYIQSAPSFEDDQEFSSFLHFQQEAVPCISGTYETTLWDLLIMQSCRNDVSLRRLAASIGALMKARELRSFRGAQPMGAAILARAEGLTRYSFQQYGRGLRAILQTATSGQGEGYVWTRKVMIASILIYCFESMNGSIASAILHVSKALQLMQKQFEPETRRYKHLATTTRHQRLEQDLISALVRLDAGVMSRRASQDQGPATKLDDIRLASGTRARILSINFGHETLQIPSKFSSAIEARRTIEYIQFWALLHLFDQFFSPTDCHPTEVDLHTKRLCEAIMDQLRQWKAAFEALRSKDPQPKKYSKQYLALLTPRLQATSYGILVQRVYFRGTAVDLAPLDREVREVIRIGRTVMDDPKFYRGFVFECEILPSLFVVATSATDILLRQEAIQLLKQSIPRQESGWDSVTLTGIAEEMLPRDAEQMTKIS